MADLGFEQKLWITADKMRNNMDAAEYKHVVLGLIFLKYISDAFIEVHSELEKSGEDAEDIDEYKSRNIFWVPPEARWEYIKKNAKQPTIGKLIDDAMDAIERDNAPLKGVLPSNYARPQLESRRLGELIDLISTIGLGDKDSRSKDILGKVYEYFLGQFADAEGKRGGQFYTPRSIVKLLVSMLEPYKGRVFDPCCGSGGMFVQSEKFVESHQGRKDSIHIYGQESNQTTWKLCKMNLSIRSIDSSQVKWNNEGSFLNDEHKDLRADFIIANPPFNDSDWKGELLSTDARWKYGLPPAGNANFAWVQHFIHHLSPTGVAGFVLANGSMSSNTSGEGEIRKRIVEDDVVDCMVALPSQLFYNTMIPACLWFVARDKKNHKFRDRRGEFLFIDARNMGLMTDRRHRELVDADISKISSVYHAWRGEGGKYSDVAGFCKSVKLDEIKKHEFILTPGRYVGSETVEEDPEVFDEKMKRLTAELSSQFVKSHELEEEIKKNLKGIGYGLK
ncbi:TPA: SAM-dependent DNA methyltransferase [Candidatus Woesearchaeota archaeon]|nr:SAM-dependent DNA methyltransferase [Candidatus Woesearchaeota archaeon]HIH32543.1 SAM-dependent DNA methyltransferase [Candidatus Woesearchaeota archaeon]HIJ02090.1 SAM-dependent DNA methyltransferase [Candidatus Woesearchaeota archaeon]